MEIPKQKIFILSSSLPRGHIDLFMLPELEELCKRNVEITLVPFNKSTYIGNELNSKVKTNYCMYEFDQKNFNIDLDLIFIFFKVISIDLANNKGAFWKTILSLRRIFSYYKTLYFKATLLKNSVGEFHENTIFYSYWWEELNIIVILLKLRGEINNSRIVTRTHGFDLYVERQNKFIALRGLQLFYTDEIYTISQNGENYLKNKYKAHKNKVNNFYLGIKDHGFSLKPFNKEVFQIVSVSDFRDVKRVWLIPEILKHLNIKVKWTHIGGGKGFDEFAKQLNEMDFPYGVQYELKGFINNDDLFNLYQHNTFDLFLNVSSYEGLPVSIMEAISVGIPAMATNVGGTNEIVNERTGILIERDFEPSVVAEKLEHYASYLRKNELMRTSARDFWKRNFLSEINNNVFIKHLLKEPDYQVCTCCVLSTADDRNMSFDFHGVCNYCSTFEKDFLKYTTVSSAVKRQQLEKISDRIIKECNRSQYNCIIGISGGVDSSYVAIKAYELGLKALLIHFDNGWNSELAVKNIEQISKYTGFDLYTYVVDWEEFKDLQKAYIKAGVIDWEVPTDHGLWAITLKKAKEMNIKYVLTGFNYQTEGILPKPMRYDKGDLKNLKDIYKKFGKGGKFKSFPTYGFWWHQYMKLIWGLKIEPILCYLDYNKHESKRYLIEKIGWKDYGGKHYESIFTRFYQGFALKEKFGVDKRKAHLASMICSGQISREEAIYELDKPLIDPHLLKDDMRFFLKKMDFSEEEFQNIITSIPVPHEIFNSYSKFEYPIFKFILHRLVTIKNLFKFSKN